MSEAARILIIDDEEAVRCGAGRGLASQGHLVEEASDGVTALEKIAAFRPEVIVSDIDMPGIDGIALLKTVNAQPDPPLVVLITGGGSESMAIDALRSGAYDYLSKPFDIEELRAAVRKAVEKKRLLAENRRYQFELEQALAELKRSQASLVQAEKMACLMRLVGGIAHEINNPLGVLRSSIDTVERAAAKVKAWCASQAGTKPVDEMLEMLTSVASQSQAACDRISGVVSNLREFAQLDRAEVRRAKVTDGIQSTLRLLQHELEPIRIEADLADGLEVEGDVRQLNQLFMNLFLNAAESIREAGRPGTIRVAVRRDGSQVLVEVSDDGQGIPPEDLPNVFDPRFLRQGNRIRVGFGLPICYQVVQAHRGRIEVESKFGEGSRFVVRLPAAAET
mgnify:CR=1 FL=1